VVGIASFIRLIIVELGARPLRNDWQQVLAQEEAF
jgi:hypothetical protein